MSREKIQNYIRKSKEQRWNYLRRKIRRSWESEMEGSREIGEREICTFCLKENASE